MLTAIIKYNAGNIRSVDFALQRLGVQAVITDDVNVIRNADKVIFPGVGEASSTMQHLRQTGLDAVILSLEQPVLGICLGMQLLCQSSEEGNIPCLGVFPEKVIRFNQPGLKIPHMGWNQIHALKSPIMHQVKEGDYAYFVHSYYAESGVNTVAVAHHGNPFSAALWKDNFFATQFHPEKSGTVGMTILKNFIAL